jgi:UPF0755 protein
MYYKKILLGVALVGLVVIGYFSYFVYQAMLAPNTAFQNEEAFIFIPSDASYNDVREDLEPLLRDIETFDALAKQKKYIFNVKPGKYRISKDMNNNDIINSIRSDNIPVQVSFNNQHTLENLAGRIAVQIEADSLSLLEAMNDSQFLAESNFNEATSLGMYIPNSYEFFWNSNATGFRDRMLKEYKRFWNKNRLDKAKAMNLNPNEVIALASIVQEESKEKMEQPRIAGVYVNRLKNNWPLQADPTLKFAAYKLPEYQSTVIKRVLYKHMEIDSPYNTYKYTGLPPGLIAMPDITAVDAVLNYEKHDYFFFAVDVSKPGYHKFAKSLSQHNRNARDYHEFLDGQGIRK